MFAPDNTESMRWGHQEEFPSAPSTVSLSSSSSSASASKAKRKKSKPPSKAKKLLPEDFQPSSYTVLCGRSRDCFESEGNRRFRVLVNMNLEDYLAAPGKQEKSKIVTRVMKQIRQHCPVGAFVAFENGRYWEVSERTAREKVGGFFRDSLPTAYRSSAKAKLARKKAREEEVVGNWAAPCNSTSEQLAMANNNNAGTGAGLFQGNNGGLQQSWEPHNLGSVLDHGDHSISTSHGFHDSSKHLASHEGSFSLHSALANLQNQAPQGFPQGFQQTSLEAERAFNFFDAPASQGHQHDATSAGGNFGALFDFLDHGATNEATDLHPNPLNESFTSTTRPLMESFSSAYFSH